MNGNASLSVIITAFERSEFLSNAIQSVEEQIRAGIDRDLIVVKNFVDPVIDLHLREIPAKSILLGKENIGTYIAKGIESCKGEILLFLDDDDEFFPDKLDYVQSVFLSDPEIGYVHNNRIILDEAGKEIISGFREKETRFIRKIGQFTVEKPVRRSDANNLIKAAAYGYMSSIAIRRAIVLPYLDCLRKMESLQDFFMFYCALLSPYKLSIQSKELTKYRVHGSNISVFRFQSEEKLESNITNFLAREKNAALTILQLARKVRASSVILKMMMYDLYTRKVNLNMVEPGVSKVRVLTDSMIYFRFSFVTTFVDQLRIFGRCMMFIFSPKRTRRFFVRRFSSR